MSDKKEMNNRLYKTTESILYNFRSLKNSILVAEEELEELRLDLKGLYAELRDYERDCNGAGSGTFGNGISNITQKKVLRKEKIVEELLPSKRLEIEKKKHKINKDKRRIKNIESAITNLEPRTGEVVRLYYVEKFKINDICDKVFLEEKQVRRIKNVGITGIRNQIFGFEALEEDGNLISMLKAN